MTTAEAAASLFGAEDPASDLFASLGTESSAEPVFDTSLASHFPSSAEAGDYPDTSLYNVQEPVAHQPDSNHSGGGYQPLNGYTQSQEQWQYEPQAYQPTDVQNTTPAAAYPYAANSYALADNRTVPVNPPVQTAYNPYAPSPITQSYAVPPVPPSTVSQSTYSPYAPTTPSTTAHASSYSTTVGNSSYPLQKTTTVPPPPAPAPVLNRPKLSNAYDPPFPTSRSTRRGVSSSARSSAYASYSSAPPPPLPSGGQFTPSGYPLPPPPPPESTGRTIPDATSRSSPLPNAPFYNPDGSSVVVTRPPPSRQLSSAYEPSGEMPHFGSKPSYDSAAQAGPDFGSGFGQSPTGAGDAPPLRSLSPAKSSGPRSPSRSNSLSSQTGGPSADTSFLPPTPLSNLPGGANRISSPASFSARSSTVSPDPYTNGSGIFPASVPGRMGSPASVYSLDRARSPPSLTANHHLPNSNTHRAPSPLKKSTIDSHEPLKLATVTNGYSVEGSSPLSNGLHSSSQYLPPVPPALARNRSASSGSIYSSTSSSPEHPYAPSQLGHGTQRRSETDYGSYVSRYNYSAPNEASAYDLSASQEIIMKPVQATAYAPSPSLLGANDPLGRTSSRAPVFSFGFGGKFLTCFHGASMNTGFDVALSSRNSTGIHIRQLNKIIPQSALEVSSASFPGPLFSDPGTPTTGLVRTTSSAQSKAKKTRLVKYLTDRAEEISQAIGYLHAGSVEGQQAEGKLVLVNLLKIMVENDGRLSGTSQIDMAVRAALVPALAATSSDTDGHANSQASGFSSVTDIPNPPAVSYPTGTTSELNQVPIATSTLRPSALDKIQDFLLRGERRKAYHYALDERLWAHAMIIASSIDRDSWKETVNEFLRTELGAQDNRSKTISGGNTSQSLTNGREGLRVAYSLYSGQGSASVQELVPQNLLSRATGRLQLPSVAHMTPMTPNFAAPALANNIPAESLAAWADTAAMMLSSPMTADTSASLTALGDQLLSHQWVEAAHACYLLSPQTSPVGGIGNPTARIVLLGSRSPQVWPSFYKDSDPVIFTEILEFALSLAPPIKGQDAFYGLPHLQAYRFIRAMALAELGELQLASRYCEAITTSFSRGSPYFTSALLDQLKALSDRIVGLDHSDKSGFWKSTPSLDTIGRFLEGRFTKLVTGDVDPATPTEELAKPADPTAGPFSQYSTISSATSSTSPSPQPSLYNLNSQPARSGSAMGQSGLKSHAPDRASSAMDHVRRRPSPPAPRIASANASTTTFAQAPSFVQAYNNYSPNPYSPSMNTPKPPTESTQDAEDTGQEVSWWGPSSYGNDSANQTPMAATFMHVDSGVSSSSDGFISLMDDAAYSVAPTTKRASAESNAVGDGDDDDDDDLGFGNSKHVPKKEKEDETAPGNSATAPERPDIKPAPAASSGSWLGRWWKRSEASPGPIKASLGEETSFYYDKELKRWVNKKAGTEEAKPAAPPPPPPSRPQTASPGMTGPRQGGAPPPPARSASAADLSGPPPTKGAMRVRSNLAPTPESASLPSSPLRQSTLTSPSPPPGRPKSQASKRAIRSRYVDVFQQEGGAA